MEFEKPGAPRMDFVFTVCDNAAKEACPVWPGQPMTAHWGVPDPASIEGTPEQIEKAFREAFMILDRRINLLLCLPLASLDKLAIKKEIERIGTNENPASSPRGGRVPWHAISCGRCDRIWNHGRAAGRWKCCAGAFGKHDCDRRGASGVDCDVWSDLGAHFNPVVSVMDALERGLGWDECAYYAASQISGGISGALVAHLMFGLPLFSISRHARNGPSQIFSEFVATFGLMSVIWGCARLRSSAVPFAVGAYITAAYWFTASTSFANPAVTIARCVSDTFAGIRPADAPWFVGAQFLGGLAATLLFRWLVPQLSADAKNLPIARSPLE